MATKWRMKPTTTLWTQTRQERLAAAGRITTKERIMGLETRF